jgi:peptidoglycan hydrolase CwlO-like protein
MTETQDIESTLKEIKERRKALPDEKWQRGGEHWDHKTVTSGTHFVADCGTNIVSERIADFIAHSPTDIDFLLSLLSQKDAELQSWESGKWVLANTKTEISTLRAECDQLRSERQQMLGSLERAQQERNRLQKQVEEMKGA